MWIAMRNEDLAKAPAPVDDQTRAEQEKIFRDQPKEDEKSKPAKPEKPEKPPPLNQ